MRFLIWPFTESETAIDALEGLKRGGEFSRSWSPNREKFLSYVMDDNVISYSFSITRHDDVWVALEIDDLQVGTIIRFLFPEVLVVS